MKALLILAILSFSQGKYAGEPFSFGAGARGGGIGGAMAAVTDGVASLLWNPAGLSGISGKELMFTHMSSFSGLLSTDNFLGGVRRGDWSFAAGISLLSSSGLTRTEYDTVSGRIVPVGEFGYRVTSLFLGFSKGMVGVTVKALQEAIDTITAIGIGMDVGIQKKAGALSFGAVIHDLTATPIVWSTGRKEFVLPNLRLGAAYTYRALTSVAEAEIRVEGMNASATFGLGAVSIDPHIGIELKIGQKIFNEGDYFSIRAGIDRTIPTFGAGFRTKWATIDYAFITHSVLGGSHRMSITVNF